MSTVLPTKSVSTSLLSLQSVSASSVVVGSPVNVSAYVTGMVFIHFGRTTAVAPANGAVFRIEAAATSATGAGEWYPLTDVLTGMILAASQPITSTSGAVITLTGTTGSPSNQGVVLISDGTLANSEWVRIKSGGGTATVTCEETLQRTHTTGSSTFSQGEMFAIPIDVSMVSQLRVVADGSAHNQAFLCEAYVTLLQSLSVT